MVFKGAIQIKLLLPCWQYQWKNHDMACKRNYLCIFILEGRNKWLTEYYWMVWRIVGLLGFRSSTPRWLHVSVLHLVSKLAVLQSHFCDWRTKIQFLSLWTFFSKQRIETITDRTTISHFEMFQAKGLKGCCSQNVLVILTC